MVAPEYAQFEDAAATSRRRLVRVRHGVRIGKFADSRVCLFGPVAGPPKHLLGISLELFRTLLLQYVDLAIVPETIFSLPLNTLILNILFVHR